MRKDNVNRKSVGKVYCKYEILGLNQLRLINLIKKQGIPLFNLKTYSKKRMTFSLRYKDEKIFFAILKKMCYNDIDNASTKTTDKPKKGFFQGIKRLFTRKEPPFFSGGGYAVYKKGRFGMAKPLQFLIENIGFTLGAILFLALAVTANDFCFDIEYSGSGSTYKRQVQNYLTENGVKKFCRFSEIDLNRLADKIVAENQEISFAECLKKGNTLKVELILKEQDGQTLDQTVENLYSTVDGKIESVKVYSGTAVVGVGDSVKSGDLLVKGEQTVKENTVKTCVICRISLICQKEYTYEFNDDNKKGQAVALALEELGDEQAFSPTVKIQKQGQKYLYTVTIPYRQALIAG